MDSKLDTLEFPTTDALGQSRVAVTVPSLPDTTRPLEAEAARAAFDMILDGQCDDWDEASLYMIGNLDEARQKQARGKAP